MTDETGAAATPSLDELRARAEAASAALAAAEAAAAKPVLTLDEAKAALDLAEKSLAFAEGAYWELQHAEQDLATAREFAAKAPGDMKAAAEARIPPAEERLAAAKAAFDAHPATREDIDRCAQAVLDAREAVAAAEEA
jgi:hypothetical protein